MGDRKGSDSFMHNALKTVWPDCKAAKFIGKANT